jgi:hypothetical protein
MSITVVPYSYFIQQKAASNASDTLKSKYTTLYNSYICFSQSHVAFVKPKKTFTDFRKLNHKRSDPKKAIIHILNVINKSNFDKLFNKLRMLIDDTNIRLIITEILSRCCLQIFYVDTYIKIIKDLNNVLKLKQQEMLKNALKEFVTSFTANNEYHIHIDQDDTSYDKFCKIQKMKSFILAKNVFNMELYCNQLVVFDLNEYVSFFKGKLHTYEDEMYIDIILQILLSVSKKFPEIPMNIDVDNIMRISSNQKIKFMLHDLVRQPSTST